MSDDKFFYANFAVRYNNYGDFITQSSGWTTPNSSNFGDLPFVDYDYYSNEFKGFGYYGIYETFKHDDFGDFFPHNVLSFCSPKYEHETGMISYYANADKRKLGIKTSCKPGDKVKRKDGTAFSDGNMINTVVEPPKGNHSWQVNDDRYTWVKQGWISTKNIELAEEKEVKKEFKVGDTVKIVKNESSSRNKVGDIGVIVEVTPYYGHCTVQVEGRPSICNWHKISDLELVKTVEYEDKWHLNDGSSTIPDDADKLEKDGSVVAYRLAIKRLFKFGDIVKYNSRRYVVTRDQYDHKDNNIEAIENGSLSVVYIDKNSLTLVTD